MFVADDPASGQRVIIRTFSKAVTTVQRDALIDVLRSLCEVPLNHPSVARPLTCGVEGELPYFVHAYLDGVPADEFLARSGPQRLADLAPRLTQAAAALDFAAVAGVHHGALSLRDIIVDPDLTGVSGFGLLQALQHAGIDPGGAEPSLASDVQALADLALQLVDPRDADRIRQLRERPHATALAFAAALHDAIPEEVPATVADPVGDAPLHVPASQAAPVDVALPGSSVTMATITVPEPRRRQVWIPLTIAASLAIGLIAGFAGGFLVGRRDVPPPSVAATLPAEGSKTDGTMFTEQGIRNQESGVGAQPGARSESGVAAESGIGVESGISTDSGSRIQGPAIENPVAAPSADDKPARAAAPKPPAARAESRSLTSESSLFVDSRPQGAQVYVDGAIVGRTPMLIGDVRPGGHRVRLELPGYRGWMTSVDVSAGARTRVAASLEQ